MKVANAIDASMDELLCDGLVHSRIIFENEIAREISDCSDDEVKLIADMVKALKMTLRKRFHTK